MRAATGLSQIEDARAAAVGAALEAREAHEGRPDLAVVFASPHFAERADAIVDGVREAANPKGLIGCIGEAVVGGDREVEAEPAVSVWLGWLPGEVTTFRSAYSEGTFSGWPENSPGCILLICDPYSYPADGLLAHLNGSTPRAAVIGGFASGGSEPGQTRLFFDDGVVDSGAVGVAIGDGLNVLPLVSQGCRPIGSSFTVTKAERNVIHELGGRPPMHRVRELYKDLDAADRALLSQGLLVGRVVDEYKTDFEPGDFVVRGVIGADPESGSLAIGDVPAVGETVQFHVRDARSADEDLDRALTKALTTLGEQRIAGALLFTCNGRGARMFDTPDHDARLISDRLEGLPLAGFFAAGELGPIGDKNFVHGFTASLALFVEPPSG
jgi:small ligand-binding sensory domain FIST